MDMISEKLIDKAAAELGNLGEDLQSIIDELQQSNPIILSYILSDNFKLLTDKEKDYLLYLTLVIWKAISASDEEVMRVNEDVIGKREEENWELMQSSTAKIFREKLDVFFEASTQEDLLAFVEDSLVVDEDAEEEVVTKIGREPIFVALKTIIDVLTDG